MFKLFTVDQANRMIPSVDRHVSDLQSDLQDLHDARSRASHASSGSVDAYNASQEIAFLVGAVNGSQRELMRLGVEVRDLENGVVAFPSRLGSEVVHLVWRQGQDAVTHYHRLTGDAQPHPLPEPERFTSEGSPSA